MNFNRLTVLLAATAHFIKKLTQNPFGIEIHTRRRELRSRKLSDLAWYGYTYKFCLYSFWNHRYLATASEFCEKKATTTTQQNKSSKIANTFRLMLLKPSTKSRCNDWRITSFVVIYSTGAESHDFDNVNRWIESLVRRTRDSTTYAESIARLSMVFLSFIRLRIFLFWFHFICIRLCCFVQRINLNDIVYLWWIFSLHSSFSFERRHTHRHLSPALWSHCICLFDASEKFTQNTHYYSTGEAICKRWPMEREEEEENAENVVVRRFGYVLRSVK